MTGVSYLEPLTFEHALAIVHPDHREMVRRHVDGYSPGEGRRELEFKIVKPDGEVRWLSDRGQSLQTRSNPVYA